MRCSADRDFYETSNVKNHMTVQQLQELGFKPHEAMVYTALLELGQARATQIGERAKIHRDLTYFYLDMLIKKKLVTVSRKHRVSTFIPSNPDVIIDNLEEEDKILQQKKALAKQLCAQYLKPMYEGDQNFRVYQTEGEEASNKIRKYIFETGERVRELVPYDDIMSELPIQKNDFRLNFKNHNRPLESIRVSAKKTGIQKDGSIHSFYL